MTALDASEDLDALLLGLPAGAEQPMQTARIRGEWFFHKDVYALFDCVLDMQGPDVGTSCAHGYIAWSEDVDGLAVGVEATELPVLRYLDFVREPFLQRLNRPFHLRIDQIGRGIELNRTTVRDRKGVANRAGAATATAEQRQADCVVFAGERGRCDTAKNRRTCSDRTALFQKLSTVDI